MRCSANELSTKPPVWRKQKSWKRFVSKLFAHCAFWIVCNSTHNSLQTCSIRTLRRYAAGCRISYLQHGGGNYCLQSDVTYRVLHSTDR